MTGSVSVHRAARLRTALAAELPAAVRLRHRLHADPHVSGDEGPTAAAVVSALGWGEAVPVADTGRFVAPGRAGVVLRPNWTACR